MIEANQLANGYIYSQKIIYTMTQRNPSPQFLTPEKRSRPDAVGKGVSTTLGSRFGQVKRIGPLAAGDPNSNDRNQSAEQQRKSNKLLQLQSQVAQLQSQVRQNPKINRNTITDIFGWDPDDSLRFHAQRTLLKELGSKVQGLIKENSKLKNSVYSDKVSQLKSQNVKIKDLMNQAAPNCSEQPMNSTQIEENPIMKDYIQRTNRRQQQQKPEAVRNDKLKESAIHQLKQVNSQKFATQTKMVNQPLFNQELLSIQRLEKLKKYFTLYINTAIDTNDDKFAAEQKYIKALEKRLVKLEKIEEKLDHYRFEREVKLQNSSKKTKNYSIAGPNIKGQQWNPVAEEQIQVKQQLSPSIYFSSKQKTRQISDEALKDQLFSLRQQNSNLKQLYQIVKQNYEKQIEEHLRDNSEREKLLYIVQKLQMQNKKLKEQRMGIKGGVIFYPK